MKEAVGEAVVAATGKTRHLPEFTQELQWDDLQSFQSFAQVVPNQYLLQKKGKI